MTGIEILLHLLAQFGVRCVFGNPGTTELPLSDAVAGDDRFQYVLGLQEVPVMAMADGYAMATGSLAVVNLHASCGLGSAMGVLYSAYREGTPLLVTAGQQDRRLLLEEPILAGDLVQVARPWTKWAYEVPRLADLPAAVRRAAQTALTPPTGPVFLALPVDLQMESAEGLSLDLSPISVCDPRVRPPAAAIRRAADTLLSAQSAAVLAGSRVTERGACRQLARVAELLGAPVYSESGASQGRLPLPSDHPLYAGSLPLWSPEVRLRLAEYDVLLVTGMDLLRQYVYHEPARAIPEATRIVHLDEDPWQLGKNYAVEVGVLGHTPQSLEELGELLQRRRTDEQAQAAHRRLDQAAEQRRRLQSQLRQRAREEDSQRPMTPLSLMTALADAIGQRDDVAVVEEAVTTTNTTLQRLGALRDPAGYFGHRGWTLGWGLACAVGAQLAWPERRVLAVLGEGAALYGIQGLWSAARYRAPVTFVICNNAQYRILKIGARGFDLPQAQAGRFTGMDLCDPEIDFVQLARSMGVEAWRVESPDELRSQVARGLSGDRPLLIDVPHQRETPSRLDY